MYTHAHVLLADVLSVRSLLRFLWFTLDLLYLTEQGELPLDGLVASPPSAADVLVIPNWSIQGFHGFP